MGKFHDFDGILFECTLHEKYPSVGNLINFLHCDATVQVCVQKQSILIGQGICESLLLPRNVGSKKIIETDAHKSILALYSYMSGRKVMKTITTKNVFGRNFVICNEKVT